MLKHASQRFKSTILKQLITELEGKYSVEVLCSSLGEEYLDGMIVREKSIAIITDDVAPELKHIQTIDVSQAINIDGPTEKELTTNKKIMRIRWNKHTNNLKLVYGFMMP